MTRFIKLSLLGAALAMPVTSAFAETISGAVSISGGTQTAIISGTSNSSGTVTFAMPTPPAGQTTVSSTVNFSTITSSFCAANCIKSGDVVSFTNYTFGTTGNIFSVTDANGYTLSFMATGVNGFNNTYNAQGQVNTLPNNGYIELAGRLYLTGNGSQGNQVGTFRLSNLGDPNAPIIGTFTASASASPTPEPSSLMLLGTGLLSAAGVALRKRSLV